MGSDESLVLLGRPEGPKAKLTTFSFFFSEKELLFFLRQIENCLWYRSKSKLHVSATLWATRHIQISPWSMCYNLLGSDPSSDWLLRWRTGSWNGGQAGRRCSSEVSGHRVMQVWVPLTISSPWGCGGSLVWICQLWVLSNWDLRTVGFIEVPNTFKYITGVGIILKGLKTDICI